jgi:hypothetical protein
LTNRGAVDNRDSAAAGDLVGRPILRQTAPDESVNLGTLHLVDQRSRSATLAGPFVGQYREVVVAVLVAAELAADRAPVPAKAPRDRGSLVPGVPHLGYHFAFLQSKLVSHRWDSVRMADRSFTTIEPPSDFFTKTELPGRCDSDLTAPREKGKEHYKMK